MLALVFLILDILRYMKVYDGILRYMEYMEVYEGIWAIGDYMGILWADTPKRSMGLRAPRDLQLL